MDKGVGVAPIGSFSWALMRLKEGEAVARRGWNGKDLYVVLTGGAEFKNDKVEPFLVINNKGGTFNTWVPSNSDLLADDWEIVEVDF